VKKDDASGTCSREDTFRNVSGADSGAVGAVGCPKHGSQPGFLCHLKDRCVVVPSGRSGETGCLSGNGLEGAGAHIPLDMDILRREREQVVVVVSVISNGVSFREHPADDFRAHRSHTAHDEEGGLHTFFLQNVQNAVRKSRMRAVVDGERHVFRGDIASCDDERLGCSFLGCVERIPEKGDGKNEKQIPQFVHEREYHLFEVSKPFKEHTDSLPIRQDGPSRRGAGRACHLSGWETERFWGCKRGEVFVNKRA